VKKEEETHPVTPRSAPHRPQPVFPPHSYNPLSITQNAPPSRQAEKDQHPNFSLRLSPPNPAPHPATSYSPPHTFNPQEPTHR